MAVSNRIWDPSFVDWRDLLESLLTWIIHASDQWTQWLQLCSDVLVQAKVAAKYVAGGPKNWETPATVATTPIIRHHHLTRPTSPEKR